MAKCVQIKLSVPGLQANGLRSSNSLDDQLYGSATDSIYPLAASKLEGALP
jgi:hypothetical protein